MKNFFQKIIVMTLLCTLTVCLTQTTVVKADTACIVKVPMDAQVYVQGVALTDADLMSVDVKQGRIHEIAASVLGVNYGYKQYVVTNLTNPADIQVYNQNMTELLPSNAAEGLIEYMSADAAFTAEVNDRVVNTAIAFHNRIGGYGSNNFTTYFQQGSDAYNKIVASDKGRKWGQYVRAGIIANVTVTDITRYTDNAFTAKVNIAATSGNGFDEIYDVYFLFQNTGKGYQATNFTYMK